MARENTGRPTGAGAAGGVYSHYGPRTVNEAQGGAQSIGGVLKSVTYRYTYDDLPTASQDDACVIIPSGAVLTSAHIWSTTDFATGTSFDVGLEEPDGTDYDLDGIFDAVTIAEMVAGDAVGAITLVADEQHQGTNSGTVIGVPLTENVCVTFTTNGSAWTAGAGVLVIQYLAKY